jgi:hypothetical protein
MLHYFKDSKSIDWSKINMEGRTRKALQGQWTKVAKDLAKIDGQMPNEDENRNGTPAPKKTPKAPRASTRKHHCLSSPSITHGLHMVACVSDLQC